MRGIIEYISIIVSGEKTFFLHGTVVFCEMITITSW